MSVYLDYNASAPIDIRVLDVMVDVYKNSYGNADSRTHDFGDQARKVVENARKQTSALLGVNSDEVFFTSGATESNNIAIQGLKKYAEKSGKKHILTTAIEHHSVLNTVKALAEEGFDIELIAPEKNGRIDAQKMLEKLRDDTLLVSVMHVNNETGIIQPVKEIGEYLDGKDIMFHVDATQSCGKLVEEIRGLKYDMLSCSAHKFMGPQGIGALVLRKKKYLLPPVTPLMYGGQQEKGIRPGTIPVALVAGIGKASELASQEYKDNAMISRVIKTQLLNTLEKSGTKYKVNGDPKYCVNTTVNICFEGVSSEALMMSTKQYCGISNGSACTSKDYSPSYVLKAMGLSDEEAFDSIRISWGHKTDIQDAIEGFEMVLNTVKSFQE